jgi:hypothetical protein
VRFVDFLKTTVLLSAGAATALAAITMLAIAGAQMSVGSQERLVAATLGWWVIAALIGLRLGRRAEASPPIARLLAGARASAALPEYHPGTILLNRLWPLLVFTLIGGGLAFLAPQIPGIAVGFAIIWALAWRRQHAAVAAIEERDGVSFHVIRTSPIHPIALQRTPGFKALRPIEPTNGAVT